MNFKASFDPEIRIHLTDDLKGFVYTVQRGRFRTACDAIAIEFCPDQSEEADCNGVFAPVRIRTRRQPRNL
jgi:hypothetical protein